MKALPLMVLKLLPMLKFLFTQPTPTMGYGISFPDIFVQPRLELSSHIRIRISKM